MPISNIVYTANVGQHLNLWSPEYLSILMYQPPRRKFPGACLRLKSGTFLLFRSGNVVINGVTSMPDLNEVNALLGVELKNLKLSHMSGFLKMPQLDLLQSQCLFPGAIFEPDIHPGLIFKINRISVIAYHTGSVLYCGCRSYEQSENIESILKETLKCL